LPLKLILVVALLWSISSHSQSLGDSVFDKLDPQKWSAALEKKVDATEAELDRATDKYLASLEKQENRLKKKLWRKDSSLATQLFDDTNGKYNSLKKFSGKLNQFQTLYSGHLDSMSTALNFLTKCDVGNLSSSSLQKVLGQYKDLQGKFNQAEQIKNYLSERKKFLKEQFEKLGMVKQFKKFEKGFYYYKAQVEQYRETFEDPSKIERTLLELVSKIPAFKSFFASNSLLSGLFPNMGPVNASASTTSIGLQPRAVLNQYLTSRFPGPGNFNQVAQRSVQSAQGQVDELRNKIMSIQNGSLASSGDIDMPSFKPNNQKTRSFFKRLEYGTDLQTMRGTTWFPLTIDIGLSLAYKLNDKNVVGIGASYKMGLGKDIHHVSFSNQGAGLRSFIDINIKKNFFLSGGFEYNYQKSFKSFQQIHALNDWEQSGLLGLTKITTLKSKFLKKMKIQMLWDFLSYRQIPQTQAFRFRIGYNF